MTARRPIRVALIDDSPLVRLQLSRALDAESDMVVVGVAADGASGLQLIERVRPDLVVLDLEMGELSGLGVLRVLRAKHPELPVLVFSAFSQRGEAITAEALTLGARDFVAKPSSLGSPTRPENALDQLIMKIRVIGGDAGTISGRPPTSRVARPQGWRPIHRPKVVVIGGSTGAPEALNSVLPKLPGSLPVPIVVVVHMPANFTRAIAESLDRRCALSVRESVDGAAVEAGTVWIAAGGRHLELSKFAVGSTAVLKQRDDPPVNFCRPSVDVLFESAAVVFGSRVLAIQLTGMGTDGLAGATKIVESRGAVLAQDRASSVVWGMPGAVVEAGLADEVLPVDQMTARVQALCTLPEFDERR